MLRIFWEFCVVQTYLNGNSILSKASSHILNVLNWSEAYFHICNILSIFSSHVFSILYWSGTHFDVAFFQCISPFNSCFTRFSDEECNPVSKVSFQQLLHTFLSYTDQEHFPTKKSSFHQFFIDLLGHVVFKNNAHIYW